MLFPYLSLPLTSCAQFCFWTHCCCCVTLWELFNLDAEHSQIAVGESGGGGQVFFFFFLKQTHRVCVCVRVIWDGGGGVVQYCMLSSVWSANSAVFVCPMLWCRWLVEADEWIIKRHVRSVLSEGHVHSSAQGGSHDAFFTLSLHN